MLIHLARGQVAGRVFGLVVLVQNLAMAIGPPLSGLVRDYAGDYRPVLSLWCASYSMQTWTIFQHDGPDNLGLWSNAGAASSSGRWWRR